MAELKGPPTRYIPVDMNPKWEEDVTEQSFKSPESSNIHSAKYFPHHKLLVVCFKYETGGIKSVYTYENFPMKEWVKWVAAESKGGHFNSFIRPIFEGKILAK